MFMSWASPRSIPGGFGLNRIGKRAGSDHKRGSSFWSKFCYSCAIVILASILWIWAIIIHDIYKKNITFMYKTFYMIGATVVASVIFVIIVYITMTFRPPRRPSATMSAHEDHEAENQVN
jgi:uncharacterized membrane protein YcjF (UPF0283 family)